MMDLILQIATVISAIGAINWGLKPLCGCDLIAMITSPLGITHLDTALYIIVGISGVILLAGFFKMF